MRNIGVWCYVVLCFCIAPETFRSSAVVLFPLAPGWLGPATLVQTLRLEPSSEICIVGVLPTNRNGNITQNSKQNRVTSSIPVKPRMFDTFQQRASHAAMTSRGNSKSEMFYQNIHYHDPAYSSIIISCFWQQVEVHLLLSLGTGDTKCLMSIWHVRFLHPGELHSKNSAAQALWFHTPYHPCMIFTYILWQM